MTNKGVRLERELFRKLWNQGLGVMRSPSSGGGRKHHQPDLVFTNGDTYWAVECKATGKDRIYVGKEELLGLLSFCKRFGALAVLGVRFDRAEWRLLDPSCLEDVGKSLKVSRETALKGGTKLDEL